MVFTLQDVSQDAILLPFCKLLILLEKQTQNALSVEKLYTTKKTQVVDLYNNVVKMPVFNRLKVSGFFTAQSHGWRGLQDLLAKSTT